MLVDPDKRGWIGGARIALINLAVFALLFAGLEVFLHLRSPDQNPLLRPPFAPNPARIKHETYSHTLRSNFDGEDWWGGKTYPLHTNALGFKDARSRPVPNVADRRRILFIGDSFTEAVGLPYEQTFVGRFAAAFPQYDVLNAGVSSYAPSVYYAKTKALLESGLRFDELMVYLDISDVQDEAITYRADERGALRHLHLANDEKNCPAPPEVVKLDGPWWTRVSYVADYLYKRHALRSYLGKFDEVATDFVKQSGLVYARDLARASWTYDPAAKCYGDVGIEGGIAREKEQMDRLYELLSAQGVALSVGVYPWPQQLLYDTVNSRQVAIWRTWCEGKCRRFFDHYPVMFAYMRDHKDGLRDLFIWPDVHYNAFGNEVFAQDLIAQYAAPTSASRDR